MEVLEAVCQVLKVDPKTVEVNYAFVSPREIHRLNLQFRQVDRPTDVLSFPDGDINPETNRRFMGDVLICRAVAKRQAKELGHSLAREITFLQVHGTLHLFGYDHIEPEDEVKMLGLQREIMALLS
ncbi:MAG: rRNA maturation RNase YbeY [Eubacteriales bacterium]|nr:rRNA maturation RNase YbeY [Eubacteriales bacterium]